MLYLKKYFTEGLIQMAILLSLCGVMVDVGLEPPAWQHMIYGPTSALTQTQFHNLRNRLENNQDLHPKNVDLDGFFTARRLLGWVHSLDRLQVPHAEVETWLVQHEPGPLPMGREQSPLQRGHAAVDRDLAVPPVDTRPGLASLLEEDVEDKEEETQHVQHPSGGLEEEEEDDMEEDLVRGTGGRGPPGGETTPNEDDQNSFSFQECLRLLEETFPFTEDHSVCDVGGRGADVEPLLPPPVPTETPSLDLELHWQDLLAIMEPEDTDVDLMTSFDSQNPKEFGILQSVGCESCASPDQEETPTQHGVSDSQLVFLPLTPSAELDDHSSALNTQCALQPDRPRDPSPFSLTSSSPSTYFLVDEEEDEEEEGGLPSPLSDLFQDAVILDEMRLLDLALEDGFSPEMAAQLEEEGFLSRDVSQHEGHHPGSGVGVTEGQDQHTDAEEQADSDSGLSLDFSRSPASSESSSYSSSSSSSCASATGSPFSEDEGEPGSLMEVETTIKQEEVEMTIKQEEEEVETTIKQEEEEMGAVGGDVHKPFPSNYGQHKLYHDFPLVEHIDHDHTYNQPWSSPSSPPLDTKTSSTRNAKPSPRSSSSSSSSSSRHISRSRMWSRDERRARSRKIPFSNELIVNLPVEEFNDLLTDHALSEEQLVLIRDIRRRGKNKIAAQNCRKRKMDVLVELEGDVSGLRRYRSRLLRERQEALKHLQEMKQRLGALYHDVFSRLRDEDGAPLDAMEHVLNFEADGSVTVGESPALRQRRSRKHRDKKK